MKAILEFNLPEDEDAFMIATEAGDLKCAMYEFEQALRRIYKYEEHPDEIRNMVERIRTAFYDSLGEYL